jgi:outer membrane immunogenic protein
MRESLLATVAISLSSIASCALAADLPVKAPGVPVPVFTWTSCFLGAHAGGGWAKKDITDPVAIVENALSFETLTPGVTTANVSPSGAVIGGQFGCDYQFAPNWVGGVEGAVSGATMKGDTTVGLSDGTTALVTARTDFLAGATGRVGYAVDRWLYYVRGGAAWAGDKYTITGNSFSGFEALDTRPGWTAGAGIEWAFATNWSARLEYDYYGLGTRTILIDPTNLGHVDVKQSAQTVKLGVNFHVWSW